MKFLNLRIAIFALIFLGGAVAFSFWKKSPPPTTGPIAADFTLTDLSGANHNLYSLKDKKAVVIIGHGLGCPIIQKFMIRLHEINDKWAPKGIVFLLLNPNTEDDLESLKQEAEEYQIKIPILVDRTQKVAKSFGFERTAETVVITPSNWSVIYQGAISDRLDYGVDKLEARNEYLEQVLTEVLEDGYTSLASHPAKGCAYTYLEK